jgi:hypothetical protein
VPTGAQAASSLQYVHQVVKGSWLKQHRLLEVNRTSYSSHIASGSVSPEQLLQQHTAKGRRPEVSCKMQRSVQLQTYVSRTCSSCGAVKHLHGMQRRPLTAALHTGASLLRSQSTPAASSGMRWQTRLQKFFSKGQSRSFR